MTILLGRKLNGMAWTIVPAVSSPITITGGELVSDRIYQRVGTTKAISLAGTYSGGTPTQLQARPVVATTLAAVSGYGWQNLTASGGTFSGTVTVPQGGWYLWQVQDTGTGATWTSSNRFGVGILIAMLGRSNMALSLQQNTTTALSVPLPPGERWTTVGYNDTSHSPIYRRYAGNGWQPLHANDTGAPTTTQESQGSGRGDAPRLLATALQSTLPGIPVGLLEYPVSGTPMAYWLPDGSGGIWNQFVSTTRNSGNNQAYGIGGPEVQNDHEMALWLHGEDEGNLSTATYFTGLNAVWNALLTLTGRTTANYKFGMTIVGPDQTTGNDMAGIRQGQLNFVSTNASNGVFLAANFADADLAGDAVHPPAPERIRLFRRYANAIAYQFGAASFGSEGPKISGATVNRSTGVIQVSVTHSGGTALRTADGGTTGTSIGGFRVFVNGTAATITSTALASGGVTLNISSSGLTGAVVTIDHQMAPAPYGANTALGAVVCDNASIPTAAPYATYFGGIGGAVDPTWTEARGFPLQPTAAAITAV